MLLDAIAHVPDVRWPDHRRARGRAGPGPTAGARRATRPREPGDVHRALLPPSAIPAQLAQADILALPNPASAISTHATSPLKLFEYMAAGKAIVASNLPAIREVLTDDVNAAARHAGRCRTRSPPASAASPTTAGSATPARPMPRERRVAEYSWDRRAERLEALFTEVRRFEPMISDRLIALVRCPECRGTIVRSVDSVDGLRCQTCGRAYRAPGGRVPGSAAGGPVRRADQVPRRGAARRRAARARLAAAARLEDPQRHAARSSCGPRPATWSSISAAAAAARSSGTATSAPRRSASTSARSSPRTRGATCRSCSATCGGCRLPTARSSKAWSLDVLEHLSPDALRGMLDGSQPRARARGHAVRLHPRAQERAGRRRPALDQPRSRAASSASASSTCARNGCASPITSTRSPTCPTSNGWRATCGFRIARITLLHADRRRVRREHPDAHGRARDGEARGAAHGPRRQRRRRRRARGRARRGRRPRRKSRAARRPTACSARCRSR